MELTEKELHCLARLLQSNYVGEDLECLYCKYAFECREQFMQKKKIVKVSLEKKIEQITGVMIFMTSGTEQQGILTGSWMENCPDLLERFSKMSLEEQQKVLKSPEIMKYRPQENFTLSRERGCDGKK